MYWVILTRGLQTEFEIKLQTMSKRKINTHGLFIIHIASFVEISIHPYLFIPLCAYKDMQGTLNSTEKTTQLLVSIVFKMYCIVFS